MLLFQQSLQSVDHLEMSATQQVAEQVFGIAALRWRFCLGKAHLFAWLARCQSILSALKHQWRQGALIEFQHFTDEHDVVAAIMHEGRSTLEACGTVR